MIILWSYTILLLVLLLSVFALKVSSNLFSQQRRFFFYALVSVIFWGVFNFAYVNSFDYLSALTFYSLMMLSISLMSGFFLLTAYSFITRPGFVIRLASILPSFVLLLSFPFTKLFSLQGRFEVVLNSSFLSWLVSCVAVLLVSSFFLLSIEKRIKSKGIKKKVLYFFLITIIMTFLVAFSFLLELSAFSFLVSAVILLFSAFLFR